MYTATYTAILHPTEPYKVGFVAEVPAMPGCFAHGETVEETMAMAAEAAAGYLNLLITYGEPIPSDAAPRTLVRGRLVTKIAARYNPSTMRWSPAPTRYDISA